MNTENTGREHGNDNGHGGHGGGHGGGHEQRRFNIIVDQKRHDWPKPEISGLEIKELAGVDADKYDAWQDVPGPDDLQIKDQQKVDLTKPGTEKFFTGKKTTTEG
jgi:multiubiquitin